MKRSRGGTPNTGMPLATALMVLCLLGSPIPSTGRSLGVVVHGYHCSALHWEEVVWGDQASQRLGRLPHAALLAWEGRDELVAFICGTGASRDSSGRLEADALVDLLFARLPQLREFDCFEHVDLEHLERLLRRTIVADTTSFNTEQECTVALSRLQREGVRRAVLVSSPTHAPRCLRDACAVARQVGFEGTLSVSPCGTSWTELEPVVLEPPHRPDRQPAVSLAGAPPPFYELARRAARIAHSRTSDAASDALRDDSFRRALDALLVRHERPEAS